MLLLSVSYVLSSALQCTPAHYWQENFTPKISPPVTMDGAHQSPHRRTLIPGSPQSSANVGGKSGVTPGLCVLRFGHRVANRGHFEWIIPQWHCLPVIGSVKDATSLAGGHSGQCQWHCGFNYANVQKLTNNGRCQWHWWTVVVSGTSVGWWAVSRTPLTSGGRCQSHRWSNRTLLTSGLSKLNMLWLLLKGRSIQKIMHRQIVLRNIYYIYTNQNMVVY
jgi:hypothetical protein